MEVSTTTLSAKVRVLASKIKVKILFLMPQMSCRYSNAKYMTIADIVARRLRAGEFQSAGQFYSRDELARAYHISPGTARAVLRVLEDRGVIECRKGKRAVPACGMAEKGILRVCRPVFFRDSLMAETPEYDYVAYCTRNILMRRKGVLRERNSDFAGQEHFPALSDKDVAVVFPPVFATAGETAERKQLPPALARLDLLIDQAGSDAISLFTRKAGLDCALHLIRHNTAFVIRVASRHSAFPWFARIAEPGKLNEYAPECEAATILFDGEFETFPNFLAEAIPHTAVPDHRAVAVLIDDPYLSDYLSGEIRVGAYHPPARCSFFGTALNERMMVFPYLDLKLDALAAAIIRTALSKAENPSASLACEFHLVQFRDTGIG